MNEWMAAAAKLLDGDTEAHCARGHLAHVRRFAPVFGSQSQMLTYDYDTYAGPEGYCPGNDDVSRTIQLYGIWEPAETAAFLAALAGEPGDVIDFGSQIGWYTRIALLDGRDVLAVEGLPENATMTAANAAMISAEHRLHQALHWVGPDSPVLPAPGAPPIAMVKIDLEGADIDAVRMLEALLENGNVANILCEISPVFNDTYPQLARILMMDHGFHAARVNPWRVFEIDEIDDAVNEFPQVDMIFARRPYWEI